MAAVTDRELSAAVKSGKLENVYYLYGKDISAVETYCKAIISKAVHKDEQTYNLHTFEGKSLNIDEFTDACEALPMFAEHVCCTVCDLNAESLNADTLNWLIKFISDLPETTVLIFYCTSIDIFDGKKYPTPKNKKLVDAAAKCGSVCCFQYKKPESLAKDIAAKISKSGGVIRNDAAVYLAELCGCNTMMIENEIAKLTAYAGSTEITKSDVEKICPRLIETTSFDLAKAIARRDRTASMRLLHDLCLEKTEALSIMYAISGNMLDLYRAKVAQGSGKSASDVCNDFGYPKNISFRVENAFRELRLYSVQHLRECLKILTETDVAMKSSRTDNMILLEEAIVKMLSIS